MKKLNKLLDWLDKFRIVQWYLRITYKPGRN